MLPLHGRGQIVFVNSSVGLAAPETLSQYAPRQNMLSRRLLIAFAKKLTKMGSVLSVYLGRTATPLQAAVHAMGKVIGKNLWMQPEDVAAVKLMRQSRRSAEVTDIQMRQLQRE